MKAEIISLAEAKAGICDETATQIRAMLEHIPKNKGARIHIEKGEKRASIRKKILVVAKAIGLQIIVKGDNTKKNLLFIWHLSSPASPEAASIPHPRGHLKPAPQPPS